MTSKDTDVRWVLIKHYLTDRNNELDAQARAHRGTDLGQRAAVKLEEVKATLAKARELDAGMASPYPTPDWVASLLLAAGFWPAHLPHGDRAREYSDGFRVATVEGGVRSGVAVTHAKGDEFGEQIRQRREEALTAYAAVLRAAGYRTQINGDQLIVTRR